MNANTNHQSNYADETEAAVAAFDSTNHDMSRSASLGGFARNYERFPDDAFPFSGDHLGTHSHREQLYTPGVGVEPGEEVRRERIHNSHVNLWDLVTGA